MCSTESGCRYGASCKFVHSNGDTAAATKVTDDVRDDAVKNVGGLTHVTSDAAVDGMATAMAGLSVVSQSGSSSLPVDAADNSSLAGAAAAAAAAACPTNTLKSAAAAAAKCNGKKKKPAKKGTKKTKQESKSKELVLYDRQTVKCGMFSLAV